MSAQHSQYLEAKILTAPPNRLHLMLIEGAIRYGRQAEEALRRGDESAAAAPLLRVIDILGELVAGVRERESELNKKLADLYWFLFRRVTQAKINADMTALAETMQLLEYERQTWQLVCEKFAQASDHQSGTGSSTAPRATKSSLSLEA
ncbi:MAG: flagellar export chaperone FliS [Pirellulales bacterium]